MSRYIAICGGVSLILLVLILAACSETAKEPPADALLWRYRDDSLMRLDQPPIIVEGMVYATTAACQVHALDAKTGEKRWSFDLRSETGECATPVVEGGVLYSGERALDAASGELLPVGSYSPVPFATGAMVYEAAGFDFQELRAIDAVSGELAWTFSPGETVPPPSVPTVSNGVVYLQLYENAYALDEATGAQIWSYPADVGSATVLRGAPVIDDGIWYLTADTRLYALDTATGQPLWTHDSNAPLYHPDAGEGMVIVQGLDGQSNAFTSAGVPLWSSKGGPLSSSSGFMVVGGVLYGVSLDGYFHAFEARTGDLIWIVRFCAAPGNWDDDSAPYTVSEGVVYLCYGDEYGSSFGMAAYIAPTPSPR